MFVTNPQALRQKLLAMMVLRVVLALAFLGITTWFQIKEYSLTRLNFYPLYGIVVTTGFLTIIYSLAIKRIANLRLFTYLQVAIDIILITVIVYITGGTESYLQTLYPLSVIGAAILLSKRGGLFAASFSSISYGILIDMDFYRMLPARFKVIHSMPVQRWEDVFTTVATNILAFFTVAYLTGYLAEKAARVERELEEKEIDFEALEQLNRHIVENITSGIMTLDERLRITSFNREAELVTGYTLKEVYYRDVNEIFPGMLDGNRKDLSGIRIEKRFRRKDGEEVYLGFSISEGQGGDASNIIIFQNLTRLKAMEEQLRRDEKLKALGEISIGIAHEIRNPLASISGSIQLLKEELDLSGEDLKLMDIVLRETDRLNLLITDYLLFAKPAKEKRELIDLSSVIDETIRIFRNSPEAASIDIKSGVVERLMLKGDARQLGQVFWNLFLNAAHAMEGGGVLNVSASLGWGRPGGGGGDEASFALIEVIDTGKGIRPEDLNRIFDPFFSTKDFGTGLGLAMVHRIIESHSGSIEVKSVLGQGTAFRIALPVERERVIG
ncbi:MAG: PAS domain S-box protein [Deltaproteobacteria bacterium]|nr:PAS domain S-box protein [Deltaproteobacteria bacterium]